MELTINGTVYQFKAGIGFMRKANKTVRQKIEGTSDSYKETGLQYLVAGLIDGDIEDLITTLDFMNDGMKPRVTKKEIESFIEDPNTNIDLLFEDVLDFLKNANVSKRIYNELMKKVAEMKAKQQEE